MLTAACGSGHSDSSSTTTGPTAAGSSTPTQPETTTTETAAPAPGPDDARIVELFDGLIGNLRLQPTTYFSSQQSSVAQSWSAAAQDARSRASEMQALGLENGTEVTDSVADAIDALSACIELAPTPQDEFELQVLLIVCPTWNLEVQIGRLTDARTNALEGM